MHRPCDGVIGGSINSTRSGQRVFVATEKKFIERINQTHHQDLGYVELLAMVQCVTLFQGKQVNIERFTADNGNS